MAKIILSRPSSFQSRGSKFQVLIDGVEKGSVKNGSAEEFVLEPGRHTLQCKVAWYRSNVYEFHLNDGDVKFLRVRGGIRYFWPTYILFITALAWPFLKNALKISEPPGWDWVRAVVILVIAVYYVFSTIVKRKSYLVVDEDSRNIFNS